MNTTRPSAMLRDALSFRCSVAVHQFSGRAHQFEISLVAIRSEDALRLRGCHVLPLPLQKSTAPETG